MSRPDLKTRIGNAIKDVAILEFKTTVVSGKDDDPPVLEVTTTIDQITGDIQNSFTESAFQVEYGQRVIEFHERQRDQGNKILERNVEALRSLLQLAKEALDGRLSEGTE